MSYMSEVEEPDTQQAPEGGENPPEPEISAEELRDIPLPPPSFGFLVADLVFRAEMHLGILPFAAEQAPEPNLKAARHSIDLLGMLQEKTKGNLTMEEKRHLENSVTELRFRFVQAFEKSQKKSAEAGQSAEAK
jgi:hypothetical protein